MSDLRDLLNLESAVKSLVRERKKMAALSEKTREAEGKRALKLNADLNWQGLHVRRLEAHVHACAVDAGFADPRSPEHYQPRGVKIDGWHEYRFEPTVPRALAAQES